MPPIQLRFRRFLILLAVSLLAASRLSAQPYTWTPVGPFGGTVGSLAVHPNDPRVIYAGADHGVFRSTDAGSSWRLLPGTPGSPGYPGTPGPSLVAFDTARPKILYAVGRFPLAQAVQVFRSADGGATWRAVSRNLPASFFPRAFAVEPSPAARLYLGTFGNGILRSTDGGVTWSQANQGLSSSARFVQLLVAPGKPSGTVFAGTRDGLYRTVNGGVSWTLLSRGLPAGAQVSALAIADSDPKTLYASLSDGIYRSADGGDSWTLAAVSPLEIPSIDSLAVHPRSPRTVYAGSFFAGGVFKSTDGGSHWTATALPSRIRVRTLALTPATLYVGASAPDPLLQGTDPGGVLRSADGGASWARVNQGLADLTALSAAIDPGDPDVLAAGLLGPGLFRTSDRGAHWTRTSFGQPASLSFGVRAADVLAPAPGVLYAVDAGTHQLAKSIDGGLTWSPLPDAGEVFDLLADPVEPETLYALTSGGLTRSLDGGASWTLLSTALPEMCFVNGLTVTRSSAAQPAVLWLAGARPGAGPGGTSTSCGTLQQAAVFRSSDAGSSWAEADAGLPDGTGKSVAVIAADPGDPRTLYVGMGDGGGMWKTTDDGASWHPAKLGGFSIQALAVSGSGRVWAATADKIFRSSDGGATWQSRGVQPGLSPVEILFDSTRQRVYAVGSGGLWVSGQAP